MNRIKVIIVLAVLLAVLSACGNTSGNVDTVNDQADSSVQSESPLVYFTSDISASGLVKNYEALGWKPAGNVAVNSPQFTLNSPILNIVLQNVKNDRII